MSVSRLSQTSLQNAFQKYNNVWDGTTAVGSMDALGVVVVPSAGVSSITFSSIPSTYTHLQIRGISQGSGIATNAIQFNGDTASNYNSHYLYGDGSSAASGSLLYTYGYGFLSSGSTNIFGGAVIDILDYANTNKYKTYRSLTGADQNGSGYIELLSGAWRNTTAVTSITLAPITGNFSQYSSFALYGVK